MACRPVSRLTVLVLCLGGSAVAADPSPPSLARHLQESTFLAAGGYNPIRVMPAAAAPPPVPPSTFVTQEYRADYGLANIGAAEAYARGFTGKGVLVAISDSGIDATLPEFAGRISAASRNFGTGQAANDLTDTNGHGTHVAGTIGAARDGVGMHGVAYNAQLLILRAIGVPNEARADALNYAAAQGAKVFNGSYGPAYPGPTDPNNPNLPNVNYILYPKQVYDAPQVNAEANAARAAARADMVLVFAAGNERTDQPTITVNPTGGGFFPAIKPANSDLYVFSSGNVQVDATKADFSDLQPYTIAVVATDANNRIAWYSNLCGVAAAWCLAAPGSDVISTVPRGTGLSPTLNYNVKSGTSMATPHVAGAVALVREAFPFMTAPQVVQTILTSATSLGDPLTYGWGLLNVAKAILGPGRFTATFDIDTKGGFGFFGNDISGAGGLVKRGEGRLELAGANTYAGGTAVLGGTLALNGSVSSSVAVGQDGTLRGTGHVGAGLTSGGTVAPGNSPGTLSVAGPVVFLPTSRLAFDIDGTGTGTGQGNFSRLIAGGSVAADGRLVPVLRGIAGSSSNAYTPGLGQSFAVLSAAGGLAGSFTGIDQPSAGLAAATRFDAVYGPNGLDLAVTPAAYARLRDNGLWQNGNQSALGGALDGIRPAAGTRPDAARKELFDALYGIGPGRIALALDSLDGQAHADASAATLTGQRLVASSIDRRLSTGGSGAVGSIALNDAGTRYASLESRTLAPSSAPATQRLGDGREGQLWGEALYGFGGRDRDAAARGFGFDQAGALFGLERNVGDQALVGVAAGYLRNNGESRAGADRFTTDSYSGTLYGRASLGDVVLRGSLGGAYHDADIRRSIQVGALARSAQGEAGGYGLSGNLMAGMRVASFGWAELTPEAGVNLDHLHRDGLREKNAGTLGLVLRDDDLFAFRGLVGARLGTALMANDALRFDMRAYWAHDFADRAGTVQASLLGGAFTVRSPNGSRDGAVLGASLSGRIRDGITVAASYDGDVRAGAAAHRLTLGLTGRW